MGMKSILRAVLLVSLGACRALSSFGGAVQDSSILQPAEKWRVFRAPALVELVKLDSTIRLDLRYASSNNFMGRPMYGSARAFLQRPAADALVRVHRALRHRGLGLTIFDAYRPWRVTKQFWDETPAAKRAYVADPRRGSIHNRGCAVDLTLCDQRTGKELPMPSPFDDFSLRASPRYGGGTVQERANREILRRAMEAEGFTVNRGEWWHFDYREWREYGILDIPFTAF
jgi:D-alanyl-D-alanine dipeptidase